MYDCVDSSNPAYSENSEWFRVSYKSLRDNLRLAYNDWKSGDLLDKEKNQHHLLNNAYYIPKNVGEKFITSVLRSKTEKKPIPKFMILKTR